MSIKNVKKDEDDDGYDSEKEVNWEDIRAIKDITSAEWEDTVFSDLSPLVVLVHNRYRRLVYAYWRLASVFVFVFLLLFTSTRLWLSHLLYHV